MLFNSLEFALFFPLVTILYFVLPHRFRWMHLLIASCAFYMFFIPVYILILFFTIIIDYYAGIFIEESLDEVNRKRWLVVSIIANVGVLCIFKYYNFFIDNVNELFGYDVAQRAGIPYLNMILPIGLSFHTFQAMSYTIEVYRGNQKAERHFGIYALYVMFYPQLVAGPIERPQNVLHQFYEKHEFKYDNAVSGLRLMLWGLFKKVVIADRLSFFANQIFDHPADYQGIPVIIGVVFFAIQIYCDFSGYSDIAIGSARVMGFDLTRNFNKPYWAKSIAEFWRKWHMSLNTWFVDYVYTPVVTNRRDWGKFAVVFAIVLTFSLSGLWHGAKWTFVFWGFLHGLALTYDFLSKKRRKAWSKKIPAFIYNPLSMFITFSFVCFTYIFFRSESFHNAIQLVKNSLFINKSQVGWYLFGPDTNQLELGLSLFFISILIAVESMHNHFKVEGSLLQKSPFVLRWTIYLSAVLVILFFGIFNRQEFIYFQF
ncbi:MAG: MBOAT family O-acyltransferase [Flavobacteriales bacterium]